MQCGRSGKPRAGGLSGERKARGHVVFRDSLAILTSYNPLAFHPALMLWAVIASLRAFKIHLIISCLPTTVDLAQLLILLRCLRYVCFRGENTERSNGWRTWEVWGGKKTK